MELLAQFKKYLLQDKKKHSKVTVKNYLADVRKFINWFENAFHTEFIPSSISKQIASIYTAQIASQMGSFKSVKRYESSLRKFYAFLMSYKLASINPFEIETVQPSTNSDLFHLKEFKNYLLLSGVSRVTKKNYLLDINNFVDWVKMIPEGKNLSNIDSVLVDEYKNRLLFDAKFAPSSVNRKLSSLRKYFGWAKQQGYMNNHLSFEQIEKSSSKKTINTNSPVAFTNFEANSKNEFNYSKIPPIRLLQKLGQFVNLTFDLLIILPVVKTTTTLRYQLWRLGGKKVFSTPLDNLITKDQKEFGIKNLPKDFYAPLKISTKSFSVYRKLLFYLIHTRPLWYKRYHLHRFAHYLHFAVLVVYCMFLGSYVYHSLFASTKNQGAILGASQSAVKMLAFSGRLSDDSNNPITSPSALRFALYSDKNASGSAMLWEETQTIKPDKNGNFKTLLGQNEGISQSLLSDNYALFLGISIGNKEELKPRQQISTISYSKGSEELQGMLPITDPNAGTKNIILALDSSGNLTIGGNASPRFEATSGEFTLSGQTLTLTTTVDSNSNIQLSPDGTGIIDIQKPIQNTTNYGISPEFAGMVQIADSLGISTNSSTDSALLINQNGTGNLISASGSGTAKFNVDYLGAGMFADDLSVNGNNLTSDSYTFNLLNKNVISLNIGNDASSVTIGATSGATLINNSLSVQGSTTLEKDIKANGLISANGGLTIAKDKNLTLDGFTAGSIAFLGNDKQISQDVNNLFWDQSNKRLGVGTITPSFRLGVQDNQANTVIGQFFNANTGIDADGLNIKLGNTSAVAVDNSNHFINFETAGLGEVGSIRGNGTNGIQVVNGSFADWAEYLPKDPSESIPFGSLVCLRTNGKATSCDEANKALVGIASEHPTVIAGENKGDASIAVGFTGIVKTLVSSENGKINPGDLITYSTTAGIGIRSSTKGIAVGRALESYENENISEVGSILVALQVSWHDPTYDFNNNGDLAVSGNDDLISLKPTENSQFVSLGEINGTFSGLNSNSLSLNSISLSESNHPQIALKLDSNKVLIFNPQETTDSTIAEIDNKGNARFAGDLEAKNASFSGTLRAGKIVADDIEGLDEKIASIAASINNLNSINTYNTASSSAINVASSSSNFDTNQSLSYMQNAKYQIPDLNSLFPVFNQGIIALGASSLTDVSINGSIYLGQNTFISENSINSIGTNLELQPLRQGNLSIMGGLATIDTEGNLSVKGNASFAKDVEVKGILSVNIISPVPNSDLIVNLAGENNNSKFIIKGEDDNQVLSVNKLGDLIASGAAKFKDLATETLTVIRGVQADTSITETTASGSAGTAVIKANQTERTITTPYVKKDSLIYVTPVSDTEGLVPYVARQIPESKKTKGSFTIQISSTTTKDIRFNWWIIN